MRRRLGSTRCRIDLSRFPRRRCTAGVTPIAPLPRLSAELAAQCPGARGPEVWVKRDDLLGLFPGGNKTRKLEFLVADALAAGADTLVTCGAPQSNRCRITLAAAVKEGLKCRFVIEERVAGSYSPTGGGNHFMLRLFGVEAITVVPAGSDMAAAMQQVADALAREGRKAYVIPGGGSNALGGLGYVACAQELQQQGFKLGIGFDRVVLGSGSSGTHGGLLAGFLGNGIRTPIVGIGVSRDPEQQEPLVHAEAQAVADLLGLQVPVPREAVQTVGGYWQPKYSVPNPTMVEAVQWLARSEALLLDPVYTGKTMAGLIGLARDGFFAAGERVLFLDTGGLPAPFACQDVVPGDAPAGGHARGQPQVVRDPRPVVAALCLDARLDRDEQGARRLDGRRRERLRVEQRARHQARIAQPGTDFGRAVQALDMLRIGRGALRAAYDPHAGDDLARARRDPNALPDAALRQAQPTRTARPEATCRRRGEEVEHRVSARPQQRGDRAQQASQLGRIAQVVQGVEVGRDQVEAPGQRQLAQVLLHEADAARAAGSSRHREHRRRVVDAQHAGSVALREMAGEQARAAAQVERVAKAQTVARHQRVEGEPQRAEEGAADGLVVQRCECRVGGSRRRRDRTAFHAGRSRQAPTSPASAAWPLTRSAKAS